MPTKPVCVSRRDALTLIAKSAIVGIGFNFAWIPGCRRSTEGPHSDAARALHDNLLDALQRANCNFFWEQASPITGLIKDRVAAHGTDSRTISSIAATGFGLTSLCISDSRGYLPTALIKQRVISTLRFLLLRAPVVNGFFYHFMDMNTGVRAASSEVSSIDTAILLCGILTCDAYFQDPEINSLALQLYDRVNWQWMLNAGPTLSHGWTPEHGFLLTRWASYSEAMVLYLLAIGSRTNPIPPNSWSAWARPTLNYQGMTYITSKAPLFIHQFSHAWVDFREKRDRFANYFANSVTATRAHKLFCLSLADRFPDYQENLWGISSSDDRFDYVAWGGPPAMGPIDGTIVPSAGGGSIPFLPEDTLAVLENICNHFPAARTRYGYVNAFNPLTGWYDPDVVGIALGIVALMAENYRTQLVWNTFMKNSEIKNAMALAGFHPDESSMQA
jgi:hypothetical protein